MHRQLTLGLARQWGRTSLWLLDKICGMKVEFRGLENIPDGAVIVACKHQSVWETFVLPILFRDFSFIFKRELIWIPLFGWYLLATEQIAINRAKGSKDLRQLIRKVKFIFAQGRQLFIFPEGTRRPPGACPVYKSGVVHIYRGTNTPVLPAALNSGLFWPRGALVIWPGRSVIEFLPVIEPGLCSQDFFKELQNRMEEATNRLIDEAVGADPSLAKIVESNRRKGAAAC